MDQARQERSKMGSTLLPRFRGQPRPTATVLVGIQPGQLSSQARPPPKCQALVDDDLEGEADQDWRKSRDPRTVRHVSDGRGGHFTTAVQDHPSPNFTARSSVTRADMTISASAQKEIAQDPMGRCVRTRVKSAEVASDGCYWAVNDFKEAW